MKMKWTLIRSLKGGFLGLINEWCMIRWSALYQSGYEYVWTLYDEGWTVNALLELAEDSNRPFDVGVKAGLAEVIKFERSMNA